MSDLELFTKNDLVSLDEKQIAKINSRLPELFRATKIVGHSTSQAGYSLQTMNMISDSPLAKMKQCLSQINKKYQACQEAFYKIENKKLNILELHKKNDKRSRLKINEETALIETISVSMSNSLRQIGMFQDMYDSIRKNNNIPEDWTEKDFEAQEINHMINSSFRLAIQDLTQTGRCSKAVVEYWEQIGIHPQLAEQKTREYMLQTQEIINTGVEVTIQLMYDFMEEMNKQFKDCYKLALKRTGLDGIGSEEFMANQGTRPQ